MPAGRYRKLGRPALTDGQVMCREGLTGPASVATTAALPASSPAARVFVNDAKNRPLPRANPRHDVLRQPRFSVLAWLYFAPTARADEGVFSGVGILRNGRRTT